MISSTLVDDDALLLAPAEPLQLTLRQHRQCSPEHASLVRRACMRDRSVLPRWHQDDRGQRNAHLGHHDAAPAGAYSRIPAWSGRDHWVNVTVPVAIAVRPDVLRKHHVSPAMLREAARVKSGYAQQRNGRRCIVRPKTLASVLQVTDRHVKNINACLRELGLEVVVRTGRMLNETERYACWRRGSRQRGLASEVALTTPAPAQSAVDEFTPPKRSLPPQNTYGYLGFLHGLAAEREGAASPQPRRKRRPPLQAARRLAADVVRTVPWLASERPGRLAPALARFAATDQPWTAQDVAHAITTHNLLLGRGPITPDKIRTRPAALLAAILRGLDELADHPTLDPFGPATPPPPAEPCGGPDCDHGWIPASHGCVRPCPDCPPAVRRSEQVRDLPPLALNENGEPPF